MSNSIFLQLAYIVSSVIFIFGIRMLGSAETARRGNMLSSIGMLLAITATLLNQKVLEFHWVVIALVVGTAIGWTASRLVKMTAMPELVALFNGFGGAASMLVAWSEHVHFEDGLVPGGAFFSATLVVTVFIGSVTFTGSLIAWGKLSGKLPGAPVIYGGQKLANLAIVIIGLLLSIVYVVSADTGIATPVFYGLLVIALVFGVLAVIPIGGGDMPVVISLLNSLSGLAACAAGFVISNTVLVVAGSLVGASGLILTVMMCKAMNRSLANVLLGGFGSSEGGSLGTETGEMKASSLEDAYYVLEAAQKVIFIPGYGMAVAQAQHAVKELADILESNGCEVTFAVHPVAGRMPGHMNVLLAEADVPYEQLQEMDAANAQLPMTDVAIVIGANDVVNPAAAEDESSPIYGMPIIHAYHARTCYCLKRGKGSGFSGLVNRLFFMDNVRMLYGDAKTTITGLVSEFKDGQ